MKKIPVLQYTLDGELVTEYPSLSEAAEKLNIAQSHLSDCLSGKRKTCGGFQWKRKKVNK